MADTFLDIAADSRPVAGGCESAKGAHLATKWTKNGVFVGGLIRGERFKKPTFCVQKVHFLEVLQPPQIDPG